MRPLLTVQLNFEIAVSVGHIDKREFRKIETIRHAQPKGVFVKRNRACFIQNAGSWNVWSWPLPASLVRSSQEATRAGRGDG